MRWEPGLRALAGAARARTPPARPRPHPARPRAPALAPSPWRARGLRGAPPGVAEGEGRRRGPRAPRPHPHPAHPPARLPPLPGSAWKEGPSQGTPAPTFPGTWI